LFFSFVLCSVDAAEAGSGNLEIAVSSNEKNIPNTVQNEGDTRFRVKFLPNQATVHSVNVKFNGNNIPGKRREDEPDSNSLVVLLD
jgi:hypothetical protein